MTIFTEGREFLRRVEVFASEDHSAWARVGAGFLVDQRVERALINRTITYPPTDAPYLQVRVYPDVQNASEDVRVDRVAVALHEASEESREEFLLEPVKESASDRKEGVQVLTYDTGARNRPVQFLRVAAEGRDFALPVKVYGRNADTNTWRWVADGGIHRWGDQVRDRIDLRGTTFRFLKVELYLYDEPPVKVTRAVGEATPHYMVLEAQGGSRPFVYYGAAGHALPHYDLPRRVSEKQARAAGLLNLDAQQINPQRLARGLQSYGHWMILMAAGIVALLGVVVLVNYIRRRLAG